MSFYINMEQTGNVAVLQCVGRMVRAQALSLLKDAVTSLLRLRVVVLDLSEVEILDAGALGMLVFVHNWACVNGIHLKLVNPSKPVRQMLELTRLTSVLHVSSVEDVIQIFCRGGRAIFREISEGRSESRVPLAGYERCPIDDPMLNPST